MRAPCVTATVEICTSCPMTIVPVRESMITRASVSGSTSSVADLGDEARRDPSAAAGSGRRCDSRARARRACPSGAANSSLIASAIRTAVAEIGVLQVERERAEVAGPVRHWAVRSSRRWGCGRPSARPAFKLSACADRAAVPETATAPCETAWTLARRQPTAASAPACRPSARSRRRCEETVTSMRWPTVHERRQVRRHHHRGDVAGAQRLTLRTLMPKRSSIDCIDCSVKGALRNVSPLPCEADDEAVADRAGCRGSPRSVTMSLMRTAAVAGRIAAIESVTSGEEKREEPSHPSRCPRGC